MYAVVGGTYRVVGGTYRVVGGVYCVVGGTYRVVGGAVGGAVVGGEVVEVVVVSVVLVVADSAVVSEVVVASVVVVDTVVVVWSDDLALVPQPAIVGEIASSTVARRTVARMRASVRWFPVIDAPLVPLKRAPYSAASLRAQAGSQRAHLGRITRRCIQISTSAVPGPADVRVWVNSPSAQQPADD